MRLGGKALAFAGRCWLVVVLVASFTAARAGATASVGGDFTELGVRYRWASE